MTKRTIQVIAANVLVAGGIVAIALWQRGATEPRRDLPGSPEAAIDELVRAGAAGEDEAYLALFDRPMRQELLATRSQVGLEKFRADLKASFTGLTGVAKYEADVPPAEGKAWIMELVFPNRNDRQRIELRQTPRGWIIVDMAPAEVAQPAIRYGTRVGEENLPTPRRPR